MLNDQEIQAVVSETPLKNFSKGTAAHFLRIDEVWGIKIFYGEHYANKTFKLQKRAFEFGAAPKVGKQFQIQVEGDFDYPGTYHGYLTEAIERTFREYYLSKMGISNLDEYEGGSYYTPGTRELKNRLDYNLLLDSLHRAGVTSSDMHWRNVGWLPGSDSMVAIDFSEEQLYTS
jgi:hypothetical protein